MTARRYGPSCALLLATLLLAAPFAALGAVSGPHGPKGENAGKSSGRCGAFTGPKAVEDSKEPLSESDEGFDLVVCEKHLREHETKLMHTKIGGAKVEFQVFADSADKPESSSDFQVSDSAKSSSDSSSTALSSSSDSTAPELTTVSFIAELTPPPSGRRHMLQAYVTAVPMDDEVASISTWLGRFARDNSDVVDGRDSITATSFKRGPGGVLFFTVFILTSNRDEVLARIVELPEYSSPAGDAILTDPQPCGNGELVGFGAEEDLAAQLSVAPPAGCSNPLNPVTTTPPPPAVVPTPTTTIDYSCCRRLLGNRKLLGGWGRTVGMKVA